MIVCLGCILNSMWSNSVWREPITAVGFLPTKAVGFPWSLIFRHKVMVTVRASCWLGKAYSGGAHYHPQSQGTACFVLLPVIANMYRLVTSEKPISGFDDTFLLS